jgi:hypothetical protein
MGMSIENIMKEFRGEQDRGLRKEEFIQLLKDVLDLALYKKASSCNANSPHLLSHMANQAFWSDAIQGRYREGNEIHLERFHVTEWIPSSPGLYFTDEATHARARAEQYVSATGGEYLPLGKMEMILGGVGSVRLRSHSIDGEPGYFLGASSTGVTHQGIPLILNRYDYYKAMNAITEGGGCLANVRGFLQVLPGRLSLMRFTKSIPKYCLRVEELTVLRESRMDELLGTVAIIYPNSYYRKSFEKEEEAIYENRGYKTLLPKSWSFCSFNPADGISGLRNAAAWLSHYAGRYGKHQEGRIVPILSDFDEHYDHFENPIEFPIRQIVSESFDYKRLVVYGDYYDFRVKEQIMGDQYNVGQAGAVGPNAHAHDVSFNNVWNRVAENVDLESLAKDLSILRTELLKEAKEPEQYAAIGAVASAETEAKSGNGAKALEYLSKAGKWTLDTATKVGITVAAAVIKESLGIK